MRLSVETSVSTRPLKPASLKTAVISSLSGSIEKSPSAVMNSSNLTVVCPCLNGIRLRTGRIFGRQKSLRDREWRGRLLIIAAAGDERDDRYRYKEWKGQAQPSPAKSQSHPCPLPVTAAHMRFLCRKQGSSPQRACHPKGDLRRVGSRTSHG